ncbi:hypothetical protein [Bradyrhizobium sp. SZCCHNS3052]|uniref:hypothetical protein n=1 Tax=Bradyrhizobium sp. SZCCHNS3052 TaxID=3057321 RepID=UPI0029167593|nr:hypothetical protein [Bradyrhizobium sp. SZCCHNS3052]
MPEDASKPYNSEYLFGGGVSARKAGDTFGFRPISASNVPSEAVASKWFSNE